MNSRLQEIAAMMRAQLSASRLPMEIDASAYADEVELLRNFEVRIRTPGKLVSAAGGRIDAIKQVMPDMRFTDTWLSIGEDAICVKFKMVGTLPTGEALELPFCEIFHVSDRVISRIDLYSSAQQDQKIVPFVFSIPGQNMNPDEHTRMTPVYAPSQAPPTVAQKAPYPMDVEPGKVYWWCRCGKSKSQPLCDGSHAGTQFLPLKFATETKKTVYFCGCKATHNAPLCDGTHKRV